MGLVQLQVVNQNREEVSFQEELFNAPLSLSAASGLLTTAADSLPSEQDSLEAILSKKAPVKQGDPCGGCDGPPGGGMDGGTLPTVTIVAPPMPSPMYFTNYTLPNSNYGLYPSPEPGSSSIVSGSSVGSNSSMNALTRIIPRHPVDGQLFTYRDSQGNLVTLIYHADTKSWLLPALNVKGTPKTGLYDGKVFTSTNGIRYIYLQDYWSYPVLKAPPPPPIDNEIEIVLDPCAGYKRMLELQRDKKKEAAAFLTKDGKVIILPMEKNTDTTAVFYGERRDAQNKVTLAVYNENSKRYVGITTYAANGYATTTVYEIAAYVHTHPIRANLDTYNPSSPDKVIASEILEVKHYIISDKKIVEFNNSGTLNRTQNNCK